MPSILESNFRTLQKRDRFESDKLDEALELYLNAIPKVQKVVDVGDPIIGDINVTSPTGLATHYSLTKVNLAKYFWDNL